MAVVKKNWDKKMESLVVYRKSRKSCKTIGKSRKTIGESRKTIGESRKTIVRCQFTIRPKKRRKIQVQNYQLQTSRLCLDINFTTKSTSKAFHWN